SVTICEHDCQPFLSKNSILASIQKHYTGNKHLFQSFYACKIKKLSMTSHFFFSVFGSQEEERDNLFCF
ncbi:hypothetical protein, partial [Absiella sp. AM27-20]|uniref:hypothetical protein n=1 Tax=Absiella sp. AM27-20 TaxID=2292277 RepID=UPI001F31A861